MSSISTTIGLADPRRAAMHAASAERRDEESTPAIVFRPAGRRHVERLRRGA